MNWHWALIIIFSFEIAPLFDTKSLTSFKNNLLCDELALLKFWKNFLTKELHLIFSFS